MPAKKVTVTVPEYLYQWLSDISEQEFRTIPQQIVVCIARAFEGYTPSLEDKSNHARLVARDHAGAAVSEPAGRSVHPVLVPDARYPVLAEPPSGKVTTIRVHGIEKTMGATLSLEGNGNIHRIEPDLWLPAVEQKYQQMYGRLLSPMGQNGGWLYLS